MKVSNVLWGLVLIIFGVIFGLNALEITNIDVFFSGWWTLFIIIPSFIDLFKEKNKIGNIVGLIIGVSLLLASQGVLSFSLIWKLALPVTLILIGLSIVFKDIINVKVKDKIKELNANNNGLEEYCATFGGQDLNFANEKFEGCNLSAVFGGVKCDLRETKLSNEVIINATSIFGGIDILVPEDVVVKVKSFPLFGGVSNDKKKTSKDAKIVVYVNAICMFGGVEIK